LISFDLVRYIHGRLSIQAQQIAYRDKKHGFTVMDGESMDSVSAGAGAGPIDGHRKTQVEQEAKEKGEPWNDSACVS
jgi:hypothetical protein